MTEKNQIIFKLKGKNNIPFEDWERNKYKKNFIFVKIYRIIIVSIFKTNLGGFVNHCSKINNLTRLFVLLAKIKNKTFKLNLCFKLKKIKPIQWYLIVWIQQLLKILFRIQQINQNLFRWIWMCLITKFNLQKKNILFVLWSHYF